MISIEVAFATKQKQTIIAIQVPQNTTIADAIIASKITDQFPDYDLSNLPFGIFGKKVSADYCLRQGDRIELYRPLAKSPNQRRLERIEKKQ